MVRRENVNEKKVCQVYWLCAFGYLRGGDLLCGALARRAQLRLQSLRRRRRRVAGALQCGRVLRGGGGQLGGACGACVRQRLIGGGGEGKWEKRGRSEGDSGGSREWENMKTCG